MFFFIRCFLRYCKDLLLVVFPSPLATDIVVCPTLGFAFFAPAFHFFPGIGGIEDDDVEGEFFSAGFDAEVRTFGQQEGIHFYSHRVARGYPRGVINECNFLLKKLDNGFINNQVVAVETFCFG